MSGFPCKSFTFGFKYTFCNSLSLCSQPLPAGAHHWMNASFETYFIIVNVVIWWCGKCVFFISENWCFLCKSFKYQVKNTISHSVNENKWWRQGANVTRRFSLLQRPQFQSNTQTCGGSVPRHCGLFAKLFLLLFIQDESASSPRAQRTFTAWRKSRGGLATPSPCPSPATLSTPSLTPPCPPAAESDANWWTTTCSKNRRGRGKEKWDLQQQQQQQPTRRPCQVHMSQRHGRGKGRTPVEMFLHFLIKTKMEKQTKKKKTFVFLFFSLFFYSSDGTMATTPARCAPCALSTPVPTPARRSSLLEGRTGPITKFPARCAPPSLLPFSQAAKQVADTILAAASFCRKEKKTQKEPNKTTTTRRGHLINPMNIYWSDIISARTSPDCQFHLHGLSLCRKSRRACHLRFPDTIPGKQVGFRRACP